RYFRSAAPLITAAVGLLVLAPHLVWLVDNDFGPFRYRRAVHHGETFLQALNGAAFYFFGSLGYAALPLLLALLAGRPGWRALADTAWPASPDRRFAVVAFWPPLIAPALVTLIAGGRTTPLWAMSAWTLLPVVVLSSP